MIAALNVGRHRHLALFTALFLSTALFIHWTFNDASYSTTFGSGRSSGLGLLPSRWSMAEGRIRGGPAGAWGIDRQMYTYMYTNAGDDGDRGRVSVHDGLENGKGMRKMYLHGHAGEGEGEEMGEGAQVVFDSHDVLRKTREVWGRCQEPDELERYFGRTNIRMSRGYEGKLIKSAYCAVRV
jgi:hypothetical protein